MATPPAAMYRFNRFTLDLARGSLREGDRDIRLRPKSFEVLSYFVRNAGRLLSKDELMQAAWPGVYVTEDSLVQCVKEVRRALDDGAHRHLKTVPGRGYLFDVPVSPVEPEAPTPTASPSGARRGRFRAIDRRTTAMGVGALVAICGAIGWWLLSSSPGPATLEASPTAAGPPPRLSIAVLPFANLRGDPEQEYFADGLTDHLTTDLSTHISGLLVIARNSAATFKGKKVDVAQIGRELGVRYVLEGSVLRVANQVRVNAQLIDTHTGAHLWAERLDGERTELFAFEDQITGRIANALGAELIQAVARDAERRRTDPDAADLVMRGRAILVEPESLESLKQAEILFRRALAIDDRNVDALAGLANVLISQLVDFSDQRAADRDEELRQANEAADRALALDPERAAAHCARGFVLRAQRRNLEAAREYEIAISRDHNYAIAYANLGASMVRLGQPKKSIPLIEQALRLNPRDPNAGIVQWQMGTANLYLHQDDLAIEWFLKARASNPNLKFLLYNLAAAYALKGDDAAARAYLAEALKAYPNLSIARLMAVRDSDDPEYLRLTEATLFAGLRKAGLQEE